MAKNALRRRRKKSLLESIVHDVKLCEGLTHGELANLLVDGGEESSFFMAEVASALRDLVHAGRLIMNPVTARYYIPVRIKIEEPWWTKKHRSVDDSWDMT